MSGFGSRTVVLALSLAALLPAGCGGSSSNADEGCVDNDTGQPASCDAANSVSKVTYDEEQSSSTDYCGLTDARRIVYNLNAAGYKTHLSTFKAQKLVASDPGTLIDLPKSATELGLPKSGFAEVWVFCDQGAPERQAKMVVPSAKAKQSGLQGLTQVEGPAVYFASATKLNAWTAEAKPIPELAPALARLVSAGSHEPSNPASAQTVDQADEVNVVKKQLASQRLKAKSIDCPSGVEAWVGETFECDVTLTNGNTGTYTINITKVSGDNASLKIVGGQNTSK